MANFKRDLCTGMEVAMAELADQVTLNNQAYGNTIKRRRIAEEEREDIAVLSAQPVSKDSVHSMEEGCSDNKGASGKSSKGEHKRKETYGRWTRERYENAQRALFAVLRHMGATSPETCVLRPTLREEARKSIGDTGLLDHLLKHMADKPVFPEGCRLRRRHNRDGHMEYWLQSQAAALDEERMVAEESRVLAPELMELRDMRALLQHVRREAAEAIDTLNKTVQNIPYDTRKDGCGGVSSRTSSPLPRAHTGGPTALPGAHGTTVLLDHESRLQAMESSIAQLEDKITAADANTGQAIEKLRLKWGDVVRKMAMEMSQLSRSVEQLGKRCAGLESLFARCTEEAQGRLEAVNAFLVDNLDMRSDLNRHDSTLTSLQRQYTTLRSDIQLLQATSLANSFSHALQSPPFVVQQPLLQQPLPSTLPLQNSNAPLGRSEMTHHGALSCAPNPLVPLQQMPTGCSLGTRTWPTRPAASRPGTSFQADLQSALDGTVAQSIRPAAAQRAAVHHMDLQHALAGTRVDPTRPAAPQPSGSRQLDLQSLLDGIGVSTAHTASMNQFGNNSPYYNAAAGASIPYYNPASFLSLDAYYNTPGSLSLSPCLHSAVPSWAPQIRPQVMHGAANLRPVQTAVHTGRTAAATSSSNTQSSNGWKLMQDFFAVGSSQGPATPTAVMPAGGYRKGGGIGVQHYVQPRREGLVTTGARGGVHGDLLSVGLTTACKTPDEAEAEHTGTAVQAGLRQPATTQLPTVTPAQRSPAAMKVDAALEHPELAVGTQLPPTQLPSTQLPSTQLPSTQLPPTQLLSLSLVAPAGMQEPTAARNMESVDTNKHSRSSSDGELSGDGLESECSMSPAQSNAAASSSHGHGDGPHGQHSTTAPPC